MKIQYTRLLRLLAERKMTTAQLAREAGIGENVFTRLQYEQYITLESVEKICSALSCGVEEAFEFVPDDKQYEKRKTQ